MKNRTVKLSAALVKKEAAKLPKRKKKELAALGRVTDVTKTCTMTHADARMKRVKSDVTRGWRRGDFD